MGHHKSRLGLAHCSVWLSFTAEPQSNSSSTVRSRSVCNPKPWPTCGFAVGLHASEIIPFLYHPPPSICFCVLHADCWGFVFQLQYVSTGQCVIQSISLNTPSYHSLAFRSPVHRLTKLCLIYHYNKHMWQGFAAKSQARYVCVNISLKCFAILEKIILFQGLRSGRESLGFKQHNNLPISPPWHATLSPHHLLEMVGCDNGV